MRRKADPQKCENARIRPVEAANVCDLITIGEETNLSPWTAASYLEELKNAAAIMLRLVADDNSTLGFVVGRVVNAEPQNDAEIYNIAVIPHEQQKGCGQQLFDAFARICRERQVANIWLEVRESNAKAIRFY